jgi:hypothetical protein
MWTGDNQSKWPHLRLSIPMIINMGLSGQPFSGPDIGGFHDNASPELFARWMGFGALFPFARGHTHEATGTDFPPRFQNVFFLVHHVMASSSFCLAQFSSPSSLSFLCFLFTFLIILAFLDKSCLVLSFEVL